MILTFLFIGLIWLISALMSWLLQNRLSRRLRSRWIWISTALSLFVIAEAELAVKSPILFHILFFIVISLSVLGSFYLVPKFRGHIVNFSIFLIIFVFVITYVYFRFLFATVLYLLFAAGTGIFLYFAFRSEERIRIDPNQEEMKSDRFINK